MTPPPDILQLIVDDLRRRQLAALQVESPWAFDGRFARLSAGTSTGLAILADLAGRNPEAGELVDRLVALASGDSRYRFLQAIPDGPVLAMSRALALERALVGQETAATARLGLLMGMFSLLFDGLLDEAPAELAPLAPWLETALAGRPWADGGFAALPSPPPGLAPVARLLAWCTAEITAGVTSAPGWADPVVRAEFGRATGAAYAAELASTDLRISGPARDLAPVRRTVVEKSTACIWAGALLPTCVHGWPAAVPPATLETLARAVGAFGGWVDDMVDLLEDLRADRWSAPLLELHAAASLLAPPRSPDPRDTLADALRSPLLARRLPVAGVQRWTQVRVAIEDVGLDEQVLLPALADMAFACLTDGIAVLAA